MIAALVSICAFVAGFFAARWFYRNPPEARAAFEDAWKRAQK